MRIAILSDIHGNYRALTAVLQDIAQQTIDEILTLGDNIGYGPEPEAVVNELKARKILSLMGNHELGLISSNYFSRLNFIAQESLALTRRLLSKQSLQWLANLQPLLIRHKARFCHGCPPASITRYLYAPSEVRLVRIFQNYPETFCFSGHTHMLHSFSQHHSGVIANHKLEIGRITLEENTRYLIVVGSVGQPRDSVNDNAKYVIWNTKEQICEIRQVSYDVQTTIELLKKHNFPLQNALRLTWSKAKK